MIYWICLLLAITCEVIGTLSMKYASISGELTGHIVMYVMISISYVFLSISIKRIPLGVAYALWEGVGLFFITTFSVTFLGEPISWFKTLGLSTLMFGILVLHGGTDEPKDKKKAPINAGDDHAKC